MTLPTYLTSKWGLKDQVLIDGDKSLVGTVTAFSWRGGDVQVEVSWIHNGAAQAAWIQEWRLSELGGPSR